MDLRLFVDPELRAGIDNGPWRKVPLSVELLPELRRMAAEARAVLPPFALPGVSVVECTVSNRSNGVEVPVYAYLPDSVAENRPALLHIHGGGYVSGAALGSDKDNKRRAQELGCVVISVDYRLAPEHPYPCALDDCYAALEWLFDRAAELKVDRDRVGVIGESAGGGLAAAVALLAGDRGEFQLAHQSLIYPMIDDRTCRRIPRQPATGAFVWTALDNAVAWTAYLGCEPGSDNVSHYGAPARSTNFAGLPPTFIVCGALDLFIEENLEFAKALILAGVPTDLKIYPGAYHGFTLIAEASAAKDAWSQNLIAIKRDLRIGT